MKTNLKKEKLGEWVLLPVMNVVRVWFFMNEGVDKYCLVQKGTKEPDRPQIIKNFMAKVLQEDFVRTNKYVYISAREKSSYEVYYLIYRWPVKMEVEHGRIIEKVVKRLTSEEAARITVNIYR